MRHATLAIALCASLAACATGPAVKTACLPLKPYTAAEQAQWASELMALPPGAMLMRISLDYVAMRDADRACLKAAP